MKSTHKLFGLSVTIVSLLISVCACHEKREIGDTVIRIYATNDIHGQVYPESNRIGVGKLMTYLKDKKDSEDNVLLLDQGDTWQGSIYSNINYGNMITDIMNYVHYDARTVGNHDFDWGAQYLINNTNREFLGYKTPVLAANVYDFDFTTKRVGSIQQSQIGVTTVTYTFDEDVKVGIVGTIGDKQIASINSFYVRELTFKNHVDVIKKEASKLREEGCQIVIACCHADQDDLKGYGLSNYVDLVLCGHSHQNEKYIEDKTLYYGQFGSNTNGLGYIELTYHKNTNEVTTDTFKTISTSTVNSSVKTINPTIQAIIDTYATECEQEASQILATNVNGSFDATEEAPMVMCKAIYDYSKECGYDIDFSYCNQARHYLPRGTWTYADIYEAFPFDNDIYIFEITKNEYINQVMSDSWICKDKDTPITLSDNKTITIATIDYIAFHTNTRRYYDRLPSIDNKPIEEHIKLDKNYRTILKDWLLENQYNQGGHTLYASDFRSSNNAFNKRDVFYA